MASTTFLGEPFVLRFVTSGEDLAAPLLLLLLLLGLPIAFALLLLLLGLPIGLHFGLFLDAGLFPYPPLCF